MFLDESEEDAVGPLLGVEVVELRRILLLDLLRVAVKLGVVRADHQ